MFLTSFIFFFVYLFFTSISIYCLLNMFALTTTFKILFNTLCFIVCNASILILFGLDFLGVVYIIVYAGAILILFLSLLMLVDLRAEDTSEIVTAQSTDTLVFKMNKTLKFLSFLCYVISCLFIYTQFFGYMVADTSFMTSPIPVWLSVFNSRNLIY
jgi:NADH-quinone oxidoreductase subunit J